MNKVRLSLGNRDSIRNWITFTRELYDEFTQDIRLFEIKNRLAFELREPTERELVIIADIIRDKYIEEGSNPAIAASLHNNYTAENIVRAIDNLDFVVGQIINPSEVTAIASFHVIGDDAVVDGSDV